MAKIVAKTYGDALFTVACESGEAKSAEFLEEIKVIEEVLAQNPEFDTLMTHPGVPKQEKLQVVENVFRGRVSEELANFLAIIVSKERYGDLADIFEYFTDKVKVQQGIGVAYVTTPSELSDKQKSEVKERLLTTGGFRKMEMHYGVDKSLIGGMVIRIGDRVVDSSIRTKLDKLTKQLYEIQLG